MKKYFFPSVIAICSLLLHNTSVAQDKEEKEKSKTKMGEYDEIIIKRKEAGKDGKVTIEIKDGQVNVNGKPIDEYEDDNLSVRRKKAMTFGLSATSPFRSYDNMNFDGEHNFLLDDDQPFLGVTTDETEGGAKITSVTSNSAADKAGLKKGDIITKINDEKVEDHGDVTKAIGKLKPEDKVSIAYKREGKENKTTATLGKRSGRTTIFRSNPDFNFNHDGQLESLLAYGGRPRIGIKAQDTEDGKGVKVIDVNEGSAADKSGIKKDDIITEFEGKAVNSADALAEVSRESKDKSSVKLKINRGGNSQTIEVKTPRKLKTANL